MADRRDGVKQAVTWLEGKGPGSAANQYQAQTAPPGPGRPCIEYVINSLASAGVEEIFIACGYRSQDIVKSLGDTTRSGAKSSMPMRRRPWARPGR